MYNIGFPEILLLGLLLVAVAVLVFEVTMFIDALRNPAITDNMRAVWLIGMVFFHPFVAIIYYFTDHQKRI